MEASWADVTQTRPEEAAGQELAELFQSLARELGRFLEQNRLLLFLLLFAGLSALALLWLRRATAREEASPGPAHSPPEKSRTERVQILGETLSALAALLGKPDAPPGVAEAIEELGQGRPRAAEAVFEEVLLQAEMSSFSARDALQESAVVSASKAGAEAARHLGDLASLYDLDKAVEMYRRATIADRNDVVARNRLGVAELQCGNLREAERSHRLALEVAEHERSLPDMAESCRYLGTVLLHRNQLEQARKVLERALKIDEGRGYRAGIAACQRQLSEVHRLSGELKRAEELLERALEIHRQDGDRKGQAEVRNRLGMFYWRHGDLDAAEEMVKKALEINQELQRPSGIAAARGNLGLIYEKKGHFERAEETLVTALEEFRNVGHRRGMGLALGNLGALLQQRGEHQRAREMHEEALKVYKALESRADMAREYSHLGDLFRELGDLDAAAKMFNHALKIDEEHGRPEDVAMQYAQLEEIYRLQGEEGWATEMRGLIPEGLVPGLPLERRGTFT